MGGSSAVLVDSFRLTFVEPLHLRLCVGSIDLLSLSLSLSLSLLPVHAFGSRALHVHVQYCNTHCRSLASSRVRVGDEMNGSLKLQVKILH